MNFAWGMALTLRLLRNLAGYESHKQYFTHLSHLKWPLNLPFMRATAENDIFNDRGQRDRHEKLALSHKDFHLQHEMSKIWRGDYCHFSWQYISIGSQQLSSTPYLTPPPSQRPTPRSSLRGCGCEIDWSWNWMLEGFFSFVPNQWYFLPGRQ